MFIRMAGNREFERTGEVRYKVPKVDVENQEQPKVKQALCVQCGSRFDSDAANFCESCGEQRT